MLTSGGQLFRGIGPLLPLDGQQPNCIQIYFYGAQEATKRQIINGKKRFQPRQIAAYELILKDLHDILINNAHNKYLQSFLGDKEYVEKNLQDIVWDVQLSNHATISTQQLIHHGCLNAPTVEEIAILLPTGDIIIRKYMRYMLSCNKSMQEPSLSLNFTFLLFHVCYCQLLATRNHR